MSNPQVQTTEPSKMMIQVEEFVEKRTKGMKDTRHRESTTVVDISESTVTLDGGEPQQIKPEKLELFLENQIKMADMLIECSKTKKFDSTLYNQYAHLAATCMVNYVEEPTNATDEERYSEADDEPQPSRNNFLEDWTEDEIIDQLNHTPKEDRRRVIKTFRDDGVDEDLLQRAVRKTR